MVFTYLAETALWDCSRATNSAIGARFQLGTGAHDSRIMGINGLAPTTRTAHSALCIFLVF